MTTQANTTLRPGGLSVALSRIYGTACYALFLGTILYSLGFIGDFIVPKTLDTGTSGTPARAVMVDLALLGLFALQHTVMARAAFKRWWTRIVPPVVERSTYVLLSSLLLLLLYWQWVPITATVWRAPNATVQALLLALNGLGWVIALISTFLIDHADLFGLRQVFASGQINNSAKSTIGFKTPAFYRLVRHPMMVGFLIAFWATPHMTAGHLLFTLASTGYILMGIMFEERDLLARYGAVYQRYRQQVRMLLPLPKKSPGD